MIGANIRQETQEIAQAMGYREMDQESLADFFEKRLSRLVALSETYADDLDAEMTRILRRAIFSSYLDLRDLGRGDEALKQIRGGARLLAVAGKSSV